MDGINFQHCMTQKGSGNSTIEVAYSDVDKRPKNGNNYYRLNQVDFDGRSETFDDMIRVVNFHSTILGETKLYPNPSKGEELFLELQNPRLGKLELEIISSSGKLIKKQRLTIESEDSSINIELLQGVKLSKGVYYMKLVDEFKAESFKFVIQ